MDSTEQAFLGGPLTSLLDSLPAGVLYCRRVEAAGAPSDFLCLHANPALLQMTGQRAIAGQLFSALWPQPAGAQPALRDSFCQIVQGAAPQTLEVFASGSGQWFSVFAWAPDSGHLVAFFEIITRHKQVELALHERATQLQFVLEGSELGFWDWNIATGEVDRNAQWAHMLGYTHEEMQHTTQQWSDFVHPQDRDRAWASILAVVEGHATTHKIEYRMLHKDGSVRWILDQAKVMQRAADGSALRMCGTHTDITERKLLEEELLRQAHIDYLTGVSNRRHFMECAEHELQRASRYDQPLSLLMLDIDHFKRINDQHGHKAGDAALVAIAALCRATLRGCDILGRFGGEEFAVLLPETALEEASQVAERLRAEIAALPISGPAGVPIRVTASIGVAALSTVDEGIDSLLSWADTALYAAKDSGRDRVCCSAGLAPFAQPCPG